MPNYFQDIREAISQLDKTQERFKESFWRYAIDSARDALSPAVVTKLSAVHLTHSEMQILSRVADAPEQTLAYQDLVAQIDFSQGMLSRYVKRLDTSELITRFHQDDNKKAVFLSVTKLGQVIADLHDQMHAAERAKYKAALDSFSEQDLAITAKVINALAASQD
ncbi:MarR family winged helix-turn-helix transcriptional regulator [Furfurilactobacillus siliginis]|uniref:HTH marR-type domain-containing protein n=1 Tax=Furfurilactobacillus siliginis TaxID=348151 RepID=A0A0R2L620_9LACO|nr:MarR family transcriptional regulator [Furfurilactobacillus siliginis]KRN97256.1 hypothetical protein IV55_GL000184 [Furfurilactobacillus siliginis]GEK29139.1 hypothetical protein LSI01_14500 [Furfurilactobacillus siliginis]